MKTQNKLPKGWQEVELGDVAEFLRGPFGSSVQKSVCVKREKGTYKLYEQGNVIKNDFSRGEYYLSQQKFKELEKFELKPGDIVTTCAGTLGKIAVAPEGIEKGVINSVLMRIRIKKDRIIPEFFLYLFRGSLIQNYIGSQSQGVAVKNLFATKILKKIKILLPPLLVQKKIVAILEKAEGLKQKREEADKKTNEYLKSVFYEMFGKIKLQEFNAEIFEIIDGDRGVNYPHGADFSEEGYCLFLNTGNVRENGFNFESCMFITKEKDEQLRKGKAKINDIILTTRGTVGNVAVYSSEIPFKNIRINSGMVLLRPDIHKIIPKFLSFLIHMPLMQNQFKQANSGTAQPQLPITNLKKLLIPLPPLSLQQKFAKIVEHVEKLKEKQKESKEKISNMFDGLMQKAFRGEL